MKKKNAILWALWRVRKRLPAVALLVGSYMIHSLLGVGFALGSKGVIDSAVAGDPDAFTRACLVQGGIIVGLLLTSTLNRHLKETLIANLDWDWKNHLLHGLLHGDFSSISKYHSGELLNRLNNDVRILNNNLLSILPSMAAMITKLIAAIVVLASFEPLLALVIVAGGLIVVLLTGLLRGRMNKLHKQVSVQEGKVSGFLQESLEKLLMVQAMDVSGEIEKRANGLMSERFRLQRKRKNISLAAHTCVHILTYVSSIGTLIWSASGIMAGTMTYGTMTALTQLVAQVRAPVVEVSGVIPQYVAAIAAAERLMEMDELCGEPVEAEDIHNLYEQMRAICAEALRFGYDRDPIFEDAQFTLPKGEFGVIVGHSGIGKSTLLKLMLGVFRPESGQLYVQTEEDRVPLGRSTRRLFAYVPQGNLLLSGTLRENLTITRPEATEEEIREAIHISGMDDYLPSLPKGLETVLGESAAGLSEGQAQRLSIARAILSQAPVLLLDEATSALDAATEELVLKRLRDAGKTCIAVTHRPAAIALSDWSLEVKAGQCILHRGEDKNV